MKKTKAVILAKRNDIDDVIRSFSSYGAVLSEKRKGSTYMYRDREKAEEELYLYSFIVEFPSIAKAKSYAKELCDGFYKRSSIANKFRLEEYGTTNVTYYKGGERK